MVHAASVKSVAWTPGMVVTAEGYVLRPETVGGLLVLVGRLDAGGEVTASDNLATA